VQTLDSVTTGNNYTAAASIQDVFNSNGGYFVVDANDVFMQLQYGGQGQTYWTREVHVPVGNGILQPGTTGIQFRNYVAGSNAVVSAALSEEAEPAIVLTAGGQASTGPAPVELVYSEIIVPVTISATTEAGAQLVVSAGNVTWPGGTAVTIEFFAPRVHALAAVAGGCVFCLYAGGVSVGRWGELDTDAANDVASPIYLTRRDIPNAQTELIEVRAFRAAVNYEVNAGPGGVGSYMPAFVRILLAP
jgi:hypothetical protein